MLIAFIIYSVVVTMMLLSFLFWDGKLFKWLHLIKQIRKIIEVSPMIAQTAETIGKSAVNRIYTLDNRLEQMINNVDSLSSNIGRDNIKFQNWLVYEKEKEAEEIRKKKEAEEQKAYKLLEQEYLENLEREKKKQAEINKNIADENRNMKVISSENSLGNLSDKKCPICSSPTVINSLGQQWCLKCDWGLLNIENDNPELDEEPETDIMFEEDDEEICLNNCSVLSKAEISDYLEQRKADYENENSKDFGNNKIDLSELMKAHKAENTITR